MKSCGNISSITFQGGSGVPGMVEQPERLAQRD
jgi:hypothetical protein